MTEKIPATELANKYKKLAKEAMTKYEAMTEKYLQEVKDHRLTVMEYETGQKQSRGARTMSEKEIKKKGQKISKLVEQFASSKENAKERAELLRDLAEQNDIESLKEISMNELKNADMQGTKEKIKKEIIKNYREMVEDLNQLQEERKPDFTPDKVEREKRESVRSGVRERFEGLDADEAREAYQDVVEDPEVSDAFKSEAYQVVRNRLKREGYSNTHDVDRLHREHVWTEDQREQYQSDANVNVARQFADAYKNHAVNMVDEVSKADQPAEEVSEEFDDQVRPFFEKVTEKIK